MENKLPEGWNWKTIQSVCREKIQSGGTPLSSINEYYEEGTIPWVITADMTAAGMYIDITKKKITQKGYDNSNVRMFPKGTILFSMYGSIGKSCITKIELCTNQAILGIIADEKQVTIKYLYFCLQNLASKFLSMGRGGTQSNINAKMVKEFNIPIPPLPVQEAIVKKLDAFFKEYETLKEEKQKAKENHDNILRSAVEKIIFPSQVPEDWVKETLANLCDKIQYGLTAKCVKDKIGPIYLRITDINSKGGLNKDLRYVKVSSEELNKYKLEKGDIVIARTGATVGKSFIFQENTEKMVFASYLIRFRLNKQKILPELVFLLLNSLSYWNHIYKEQRGIGQPNVNAKKLGSFELCYPSTIDEQKKLVDQIKELQRKTESIDVEREYTLKQILMLPLSVLTKAFKGELIA